VSEWISKSLPATAQAVVNLSGVTFVDSTALATLVQGMKHCRQRAGDLRLCTLQAPVRAVFELTRLDRAFVILPDEEAALRSFDA
jgi:anti-sigma B factor antagonist